MRRICFLFLLAVFLFPTHVRAQVTFGRAYGGANEDVGNSVVQTLDGGFVVVGHTLSFGAGRSDVYLVKTDAAGDTLWTRTYGDSLDDAGLSVRETQDSGYVIVGSTTPLGSTGWSDVYLIKTDSLGDTLWSKTFGGSGIDAGSSVQQTSDLGYVIAGYTYSMGAGGADFYLIKTDSSGNLLWMRTYGGAYGDEAFAVQQTNDNGYIIVGYTGSFGTSHLDFYLVKTDSLGDTLWTRTYGTSGDDWGYSVDQTSDGGYIVAGAASGPGFYDLYLVKTDSSGDTLWTRTYGTDGLEGAWSVEQTRDGGYIVAGLTDAYGAGSYDVYLVKTDSTGDSLWTRSYGGPDYDEGFSVQQTSDDGYIIAGRTDSYGAGGSDVYLVRTDSQGQVSVGTDGSSMPQSPKCAAFFQNLPNPFSEKTRMSFLLTRPSHVLCAVYNLLGRRVHTLLDAYLPAGSHEVSWDGRDSEGRALASGLYFGRLEAGSFSQIRRMTLVR